MNIELLEVSEQVNLCAADFTAIIDGIEVKGTANNAYRPHWITAEMCWLLRFKFENPLVKKSPKYKEIRRKLQQLLIEHKSLSDHFKIGLEFHEY